MNTISNTPFEMGILPKNNEYERDEGTPGYCEGTTDIVSDIRYMIERNKAYGDGGAAELDVTIDGEEYCVLFGDADGIMLDDKFAEQFNL